MIELPEAVTLARQLDGELRGQRIDKATSGNSPHRWVFYRPSRDAVVANVPGRTVREVTAFGSGVRLHLRPSAVLVIEGFGGRLSLHGPGEAPPKRHHLMVGSRNGASLTLAVQGWGFVRFAKAKERAIAASPAREVKMKPAADAAGKRLVLEDVPKVRYFADGMCPFALCLKSCSDYLGGAYTYNYILGASGACFRMSWNHTQWDEGNMDLGRLGPEPFRRGFRAVGLKVRFLLRKSWWPGETGDDIARVAETKRARADWRARIIESIRAGRPVLAFGVVGPPEVSIITGFDEGGDVMVGWSCHQGGLRKAQLEPNGMFRQRDGFAKTQGLMLIQDKPRKPDFARVVRVALRGACRVSTLPKSKTHLFGYAAYRAWAAAMLHDAEFPGNDAKALQSRRFTVWDGLIMLAERDAAATFLEEVAKSRPDVARHLRQAARLFRKESECCGQAQKPLGGHALPSEDLADPCDRRAAADCIDEARERNAKALHHLALAAGRAPGGFTFGGKQLDGLRPARRNMTLMGCIKGSMRHLGKDVDDAWLYGLTGAAFMLNIDQHVDVSGPTSWADPVDPADPSQAHLVKMCRRLGVSLKSHVRGQTTDADFAQKRQAAAAFVREKVDAGIPCYGWDGCMEWIIFNGYSDKACLQWSHYYPEGYRKRPWTQFGRNVTKCFEVTSVEPARRTGSDRTAIREALAYALEIARSAPTADGTNARGLAGYTEWIRCLESGDWQKPGMPGVHHNVACWHECRCYAERFLRLAGGKLGGRLKPRFEQAAEHYRKVREALCQMQTIFVYKYPLPPVTKAGVQAAVKLLRRAKAAEAKGLAILDQIVSEMQDGA